MNVGIFPGRVIPHPFCNHLTLNRKGTKNTMLFLSFILGDFVVDKNFALENT